MADVSVETTVNLAGTRGMRALVYTSAEVGYAFFLNSVSRLSYKKTADHGATWGSQTEIAAVSVSSFDVWFDKWTPGDSGTIIHIATVDSAASDVIYRPFDTSNDTVGTSGTIFDGASAAAGIGTFVSITKAKGGNLYSAFNIDNGTEHGFARSTDSGANWSARTDMVEAAGDWAMLFPGNETDTQDIWALYFDADVTDGTLTLKQHDDSANTNNESATIDNGFMSAPSDQVHQYPFSGAIRNSDGHLIAITVTGVQVPDCDVRVWDINGTGSITALTDIFTADGDTGGVFHPQICIDQYTNDLYGVWMGKLDGSESASSRKVYYKKSTDDGSSWGSETAYSESLYDGRTARAPLTGDRFIVQWIEVDVTDLWTNAANSIKLEPEVPWPPEGTEGTGNDLQVITTSLRW